MRKLLAKIISWAIEEDQDAYIYNINDSFIHLNNRISKLEQAHKAASKPIKGRGRGHENRH